MAERSHFAFAPSLWHWYYHFEKNPVYSSFTIQVATAIHQRADAFVTNDEGMRRIKDIKVTLARAAG